MKLISFIFIFITTNLFTNLCIAQFVAPPIKADTANPNNCYSNAINLTIPNGTTNLTAVAGSYFIWEYSLTLPNNSTVYNSLGTTTTANLTIVPFINLGMNQINAITLHYFRVRHVKNFGNTVQTIATSLPIPIQFSPSAPIFKGVGVETLVTTPSCSGIATGTIKINHTRYTDSILYIVKQGTSAFCNPITNNPPCFNVFKSGKTADTNFVITGIPAGNYYVIISNIGGDFSTCYNTSIADVQVLTPVQIDSTNFKNPECFNENNGSITLYVSGGDSTTYKYTISPNVGIKQFNNNQVIFSGLAQNNYTVNFTDTCGQVLQRNFSLKHPPKVVGNVVKVVPNCASPGNGSIKIYGKYNFNSAGFTTVNYKIYKDAICIDSLMNTIDTVFVKNGLQGGNYRAIAYSPNTPNCIGIDENFILPFNPLTITIDSLKNSDCNGQTNGFVKLKAIGGTNSYVYSIRNTTTGNITIDSAGIFQNLSPASYVGKVRNRNNTCFDSSIISFTITQPSAIVSIVTKQDIQCFNFDNGSLTASVTGGNGGYTYNWEKQNPNNGTWLSYFQSGATINNLSYGFYRSKILDTKNCSTFSLPIQIIEPDSLRIDSINKNDIPCYAGTGFVSIYASGGNPPYTQQIVQLPSTTYIDFLPTTGLQAGKYLIRIKDSKNCITNYRDTITITSPPSNLDFTFTQGVINGFNISCFGADNGIIAINATGGNGDTYSGYFYTYDNQPWQTNNNITNIPAGTRVIKVIDARGCLISKAVLFTQPNDSLKLQLINKVDVICFGTATGSFTVSGNGGVRPYKYSINGGNSFQTDSTFTGLNIGTYNILIKDLNNCSGFLTVNLTNINSPINTVNTISNITCNGGNNGSITSIISGGVAPYNLLWTTLNATTNTISNITAGNYNLKVTDNVGCIKSFNIIVVEPAALLPVVTPYPVCYGTTTGKIDITPLGGTAPYLYSKDSGLTYQASPNFTNLPQGIYKIKVNDANNCTWTGNATVGVISNNPNLNFIISSNQHALDTLTMKEISWIKPDSVKWQFHPAAVVIDPNKLEPKIKFNAPDTGQGYWVKLIGYYPTCTYETQKIIKIYPYDPNAVTTPSAYNRGIKKAELFPNPNTGQFTLNVEFYKLQKVTVYITSVSGVIVSPKQVFPLTMNLLKNYTTEMNGQPPGSYILRIVSDYDSKYILFIKQ